MRLLEDSIVEAAIGAVAGAATAEVAICTAVVNGVGTNRRDPDGPFDPELTVLSVRSPGGDPIACMLVFAMHPTVLHEDNRQVSADFPGYARDHLQKNVFNEATPVLYHTAPCGNPSPTVVCQPC